MTLRRNGAVALFAAAALTLTACTSDDDGTGEDTATLEGGPDAAESGGGTVLDQPFDKPEMDLVDTDGEPFDFVADTAGTTTLLYFGYTQCPDVCPLTMSNLAIAADGLEPEERENLRVVMVTSDPERDTPESLGAWMESHDPEFVGLTGDFETIQEGARSLGVHLDEAFEDDDGNIISTHGAQVLAFLPEDDRAHVLYTEGTPVETFEQDVPKLAAGELP